MKKLRELSAAEASKYERKMQWAPGTEPAAQSQLWTPLEPYEWQRRVMEDLAKDGARIAVVTPNESGKTSTVIPVAGLSFMAAFPGAQVVSTSGVERQIVEQLWPVLRAALSKYPAWSVANDDLKITAPSVRGLPGSTWKAFTARDPKYAEGFHSRWFIDDKGELTYSPLMIIIDEAKTFEDNKMFDAFKRCDPDVWLVISTPGEDSGPFFDCFHTRKGKPWVTHEIGWHDCPHLRTGRPLEVRLQEIAERGEEDPFVLSWVFGKFFRAGGRLVFESLEDIQKAMSGDILWERGTRKAAMDFSAGGDEAVIAVRDGNNTLTLQGFHEKDTTVLGDKFISILKRWEVKPEQVIGDNGGLGKPIIDYMERKGYSGIRRYMADDPAREGKLFFNRVAEDHFRLKYFLQNRMIQLPDDQVLLDQMRRRKYVMPNSDSNRIRMESKEKLRNRGEKSPDRLDTIVMLYADMPDIDIRALAKKQAKNNRCGTTAEAIQNMGGDDGGSSLWGSTFMD